MLLRERDLTEPNPKYGIQVVGAYLRDYEEHVIYVDLVGYLTLSTRYLGTRSLPTIV